mgnify:CR=1 FL=1
MMTIDEALDALESHYNAAVERLRVSGAIHTLLGVVISAISSGSSSGAWVSVMESSGIAGAAQNFAAVRHSQRGREAERSVDPP